MWMYHRWESCEADPDLQVCTQELRQWVLSWNSPGGSDQSWIRQREKVGCVIDLPQRAPQTALVLGWKDKAFIFFLSLFIYFRERETVGEGQRARGRERNPGRICTISISPRQGSNSQTVRSWTEPKSRVEHLTSWAMQLPQKDKAFKPEVTGPWCRLPPGKAVTLGKAWAI